MFRGLSHVAIAVPDLEKAMERLAKIFGLESGKIYENPDQGVRLCYVELGNAHIELIQPLRTDTPIGKFLEKNPHGGLHHVSLYVDDVPVTLGELAGKEVSLIGEGRVGKNAFGQDIAFVHPKSFLGALLEVEELPESDKH